MTETKNKILLLFLRDFSITQLPEESQGFMIRLKTKSINKRMASCLPRHLRTNVASELPVFSTIRFDQTL